MKKKVYAALIAMACLGLAACQKNAGTAGQTEETGTAAESTAAQTAGAAAEAAQQETAQSEAGQEEADGEGIRVLTLKKTEEKKSEASTMPLGMYLTVTDYENGMLTAELANQSGYTMTYGEAYGLEKLVDGSWTVLEPVTEIFWQETATEIADLKTDTLLCDLSIFGDLTAGEYKLTKPDLEAAFTLEETLLSPDAVALGSPLCMEFAAVPLAGGPGEEGPAAAGTSSVTVNESVAQSVVNLVNQERAKNGLPALVMDSGLNEGATIRAREQKQLFAHTRPDGRDAFSIFDDMQRSETFRGENLAAGSASASPEYVMSLWMDSDGHRSNILQTRFTKIGVGYYVSGGFGYWCQLFAN